MDREVLWGQSQGSLGEMSKKLPPRGEDRSLEKLPNAYTAGCQLCCELVVTLCLLFFLFLMENVLLPSPLPKEEEKR